MFYVKLSFGQHLVMDQEENKMVVGYSKKSEAEITANGLNRIRKKENVHKMKKTLQTLEGYGHYIRLAKKSNVTFHRTIRKEKTLILSREN